MKNQTCCFTGHRIIPKNEYPAVKASLETEIINLICQGTDCFLAGGALGFDTMAAQAVLKLKQIFPHIRLVLALPCKNQSERWSDEDKKRYNQIRENADQVVYISEQYDSGCMRKRNRYLVDHSGVCICYFTKAESGTAYTIKYAEEQGLRIINVSKLGQNDFRPHSLNGREW